MKLQTAEREYTKKDLETTRQGLIELRDGALKQHDFHWTVLLSHAVAILALMMEQMDD